MVYKRHFDATYFGGARNGLARDRCPGTERVVHQGLAEWPVHENVLVRALRHQQADGRKWIARHFEEGLVGLCERSRRPKTHPNATPPEICEMLVAAKLERPHWGAKKLLDLLRREHPGINWCADSTGDLILKRAGLVRPRRLRKRAPADSLPFGECVAANQCWSVDFKGDFPTGDGKRCWPLTVSDNFSRYLLLCRSLQRTRAADVRPWFEALFREYGLPYAIRSDNGSPFASTALGGLSRLSK